VSRPIVTVVLGAVAAALGGSVALDNTHPALLFGVTVLLGAAWVLLVSLDTLILVTLAMVMLGRVLVALGAPSVVNYVHFGLTLAAVTRAVVDRRTWPVLPRQLAMGAGAALVVSLLSSFFNGDNLLRGVLGWTILYEPFLLLIAASRAGAGSLEGRRRFGLMLTVLALIQVPFCLFQFVEYGAGDPVQGTLVGAGAGAHVMGAVATVAALFLFVEPAISRRAVRIALACALLFLVVLGDAKTVLALLVATMVLYAILNSPRKWPHYIVGAALVAGLAYLGRDIDPQLQLLFERDVYQQGLSQKATIVPLIRAQFDGPTDPLFGIGPANTVSRAALILQPNYGNADFLTRRLGLEPSRFAIRLRELDESAYFSNGVTGSSAWSTLFSWAGVWGDTGLVGILVYVGVWGTLWRWAAKLPPDQKRAVQLSMLLLAALGVVSSYLEEPSLMLYATGWFAYVALGTPGVPLLNRTVHGTYTTASATASREPTRIPGRRALGI
jgi:hypothetical protein